MSPSNKVTALEPISRSLILKPLARVDFPEPDKPVKNIVNPLIFLEE